MSSVPPSLGINSSGEINTLPEMSSQPKRRCSPCCEKVKTVAICIFTGLLAGAMTAGLALLLGTATPIAAVIAGGIVAVVVMIAMILINSCCCRSKRSESMRKAASQLDLTTPPPSSDSSATNSAVVAVTVGVSLPNDAAKPPALSSSATATENGVRPPVLRTDSLLNATTPQLITKIEETTKIADDKAAQIRETLKAMEASNARQELLLKIDEQGERILQAKNEIAEFERGLEALKKQRTVWTLQLQREFDSDLRTKLAALKTEIAGKEKELKQKNTNLDKLQTEYVSMHSSLPPN